MSQSPVATDVSGPATYSIDSGGRALPPAEAAHYLGGDGEDSGQLAFTRVGAGVHPGRRGPHGPRRLPATGSGPVARRPSGGPGACCSRGHQLTMSPCCAWSSRRSSVR